MKKVTYVVDYSAGTKHYTFAGMMLVDAYSREEAESKVREILESTSKENVRIEVRVNRIFR